MRHKYNFPNRLSFEIEVLEHRCMLAGKVDVAVTFDGAIVISGDNDSNSVVLGQTDFGAGPVLYLRAEGDTVITFNESTSNIQYLSGVTIDSDVQVNLRDGDDNFTLTNSTIGRVRGSMGRGSDDFRLINSTVQGDLIWKGGAGASNDRVVVSGTSLVEGETDIRLGASTTDVEPGHIIKDVFASNSFSTFRGGVTVNQGGGDSILNPQSHFDGVVKISSGAGSDSVVAVGANFGERLSLRTSGGDDRVSFAGNLFRSDVSVVSGGGQDTIQISDVGTGSDYTLRVNSGGGDDFVATLGAFRGIVSVSTGGGNDSLEFWSSETFDADSVLNGGGGSEDTLTIEIGASHPQYFGFEFVIEDN